MLDSSIRALSRHRKLTIKFKRDDVHVLTSQKGLNSEIKAL